MPETVVFSDAYVWTFLGQLGILFIAILVGNVLRTRVPFLRKLYIPAAIIGGFLVLFLKQIPALTPLVDNATMEIITYTAWASASPPWRSRRQRRRKRSPPSRLSSPAR